MKLLLDTHILLWSAIGRLPAGATEYILNESNTLYFSPASIWEVVIKRGLNRPDFCVDPYMLYNGLLDNGYEELHITSSHALAINALSNIHKDPFDRILLAQAITEGIHLLTSDALMTQYTAPVIRV